MDRQKREAFSRWWYSAARPDALSGAELHMAVEGFKAGWVGALDALEAVAERWAMDFEQDVQIDAQRLREAIAEVRGDE